MDSVRRKPIQKTSAPHPLSQATSSPAPILSPRPLPIPKQQTLVRKPKKRFRKRWFFLSLLIISFLAWGSFLAWNILQASHNIRINENEPENQSTFSHIQSLATSLLTSQHAPLKGEDAGRINILLLGKAGEHNAGRDLTDTVMVMSIDTRDKKVALLSLPRDLYVRIPDTDMFTKINTLYQQGLSQAKGASSIKESVESITGLTMHYFFVIDFDGFEHVIDTLGGIHVNVERDIYDPRYPGPHYSYETFELHKGWQNLDGKTALKYVRERHDDPEGDFGRAKRQQQVIQAVKDKAFSLKTFANAFTLNHLFAILGESVKTDIAPEEIESFIALSQEVDTHNITNAVVDAWKPESLLRVSHVMIGPTRMFILVPRIGNYSEIQDLAANIFDLDTIKRRQAEIKKEQPLITIINHSSDPSLAYRMQKVLRNDLGFDQVKIKTSSSLISQDTSFIIDYAERRKPFALDELLKKFPLALEENIPYSNPLSSESSLETSDGESSQSDFDLILGNDIRTALNFEEDSPEDFKQAEDSDAYPSNLVQ